MQAVVCTVFVMSELPPLDSQCMRDAYMRHTGSPWEWTETADGRPQRYLRSEDWGYRPLSFVVRTARDPEAIIRKQRRQTRLGAPDLTRRNCSPLRRYECPLRQLEETLK